MTDSLPFALEVGAVGARAMSVSAAAVLAAAAAVYGLLLDRERRLRREAVSERLMAGCTSRDNAALRGQLEVFRDRLWAAGAVVDAAPGASGARAPSPSSPVAPSPAPSFSSSSPPSPTRVVPSSEGGPQ